MDLLSHFLVVLQEDSWLLGSEPALDHSGEVEEMEDGEAEGEGPVAVREGPSGPGPLPDPSSTTTTTNLLASVKEQVGAGDAAVTRLLLLL